MRKIVASIIMLLVVVFIGNCEIFAQAEMEAGNIKTYIVKNGDTIDDIISMLGWNPGVLKSVKVGQKIRYEPEDFLKNGEKWGESLVYTIRRGDSPEKIAKKLKVPGNKLLEWNPDMGVHFIYIGQGMFYKKVEIIPLPKPKLEIIPLPKPLSKPKSKPNIQPEQVGQLKFKIIANNLLDLSKQFSTQTDLLDYIMMSLRGLSQPKNREVSVLWLIWLNFSVTIIVGLIVLWFFWTYSKNETEKTKKRESKKSWTDGIFTIPPESEIAEETEEEIAEELRNGGQDNEEREKIQVKVGGEIYLYNVLKKGNRYLSLHINPETGQPFPYRKPRGVVNSLEKTFKVDPDVFREEIKQGRLTKK